MKRLTKVRQHKTLKFLQTSEECIESKHISLTLTQMTFTFSICSFSAANSETEPKTNLNSLRYRLESSTLEPISGSRSRRYSTKIVAKRAEVVGFAKKELATIYKRKPQRIYCCCNKKNTGITAHPLKTKN